MNYVILFLMTFLISACNMPNNQENKEFNFSIQEGISDSLDFGEIIDNSGRRTISLYFKNESKDPKTLEFSITNNNGSTDSNFVIRLNHCLMVKPNSTCRVLILINSRKMPSSLEGIEYVSTLHYDGKSAQLRAILKTTKIENRDIEIIGNLNITSKNKSAVIQNYYFKNAGNVPQVIYPTVTGDIIVRFNSCVKELRPSEKCRIQVYKNTRVDKVADFEIAANGITKEIKIRETFDQDEIQGDFSDVHLDFEIEKEFTYDLSGFNNYDSVEIENEEMIKNAEECDCKIVSLEDSSLIFKRRLNLDKYSFSVVFKRGEMEKVKTFHIQNSPVLINTTIETNEGDAYIFTPIVKIGDATLQKIEIPDYEKYFTTITNRIVTPSTSGGNMVVYDTGGDLLKRKDRVLNQFTPTLDFTNNIGLYSKGYAQFSAQRTLKMKISVLKGSEPLLFEKDIQISIERKNNLPYFKYNVVQISNNNSSAEKSTYPVFVNADQMIDAFAGNRIPILTGFDYKDFYCNSKRVIIYESTENLDDCLFDQFLKEGSETLYSFDEVWSGNKQNGYQIGGRAFGIGNGALVRSAQVNNLYTHELGHNFGLFHTFETYFNYVEGSIETILGTFPTNGLVSKSLTEYFYYGFSKNHYYNGPDSVRVGDWANAYFKYNRDLKQTEVLSMSFSGILDDTPFDPYGLTITPLNTSGYSHPFSDENVFVSGYNGDGGCSQIGSYLSCHQDMDGIILNNTHSILSNIMSYWDNNNGFLSDGQKERVSRLLGDPRYSYLTERTYDE